MAQEGGAVRDKIVVRRFPESKIIDAGLELVEEDWNFLRDEISVDEMVNALEGHNKTFVDKYFPEKEILVGPEEKPYFTEKLRQIKRRRQRIYAKFGRRHWKYISLKQIFDDKLKFEAKKYVAKIQKEVKEGKQGSGYNSIRKLGFRPNESWRKQELSILSYVEQNVSNQEAANKLASNFSAISQTVEPLDTAKFHPAWRRQCQDPSQPSASTKSIAI